MSLADELTPDEQDVARFEVAKTNLVDQMVLYGIDERQARIQVESLVALTVRAQEAINRAVRGS